MKMAPVLGTLLLLVVAVIAEPLIETQATKQSYFLHITDIHLDPLYLVGASPASFCHVQPSERLGGVFRETGYFGALHTQCDTPESLVKSATTAIGNKFGQRFTTTKETPQQASFVLYTGDTSRHDRDALNPKSPRDVVEAINTIKFHLTSAFNLTETPVIPLIGNWDLPRADRLNPNEPTGQDALSTLYNAWKELLDTGDAIETDRIKSTFLKGGYYKRRVTPNLFVIALNTILFSNENSDLCDHFQCDCTADVSNSSSSHPGDQHLDWIETTLSQLRLFTIPTKAIIASHIPPTRNTPDPLWRPNCSSRLAKLMVQYQDVIAGSYFGHLNKDFLISLHDSPSGPKFTPIHSSTIPELVTRNHISTIYVSPSIIPVNNPGIRQVFFSETQFTSWSTWYLPITRFNDAAASRKPLVVNWELEYTSKKAYRLPSLNASSISQFIKRLSTKEKLLKKYHHFLDVLGPKDDDDFLHLSFGQLLAFTIVLAGAFLGAILGIILYARRARDEQDIGGWQVIWSKGYTRVNTEE